MLKSDYELITVGVVPLMGAECCVMAAAVKLALFYQQLTVTNNNTIVSYMIVTNY